MSNYAVRPFQLGDAAFFPEFTALHFYPAKVPYPAVTGLCDGQPIGCAGLIPDGLGAAEGWIILGQPVNGHGRWIVWTVRKFLTLWQAEGRLRRIWATAAEDRPDVMRWLEALGFVQEGLMLAYRPDGGNSWLYARTRRNGS